MAQTRDKSVTYCLILIPSLLCLFAVTSWFAWRDKSATWDEPLHFMAGWIQVHYHDFRCDPEDPPLWRDYFTLGTDPASLKVKTSGPVWQSMLSDLLAEGWFFRDTLYHTAGNDADTLIAAA